MNLSRTKISFETLLYLLLFLFPLFAISVRHWSSITFSLLVLLGIVYYIRSYKKEPVSLHQYEKWFVWFLVFYVISFLLSLMMHPPERFSDSQLGNEIRFVLVIPLYFLILKSKGAFKWLAYGAAVSIIISFGFCLHELYFKGHPVFMGEYSKLFTGPVILIYLVIALSYFIPMLNREKKGLWGLLIILTLIATFSIISSEVRAAYIGYLVLAILFIIFYVHGWKRFMVLAMLLSTLFTVSIFSDSINRRMSIAYQDLVVYLGMDNHADVNNNIEFGSVSVRLELWRSTPYYLKDHPVVGVGNGNFNKTIKNYIKDGVINPVAINYDHLHNVFFNAAVNKGILGLLVTCLVFFLPLYVYLKTYRVNRNSATTGILYTAVMFLISMNEAAPFNKSNFVATYLILTMVIFHNHMQEVKIASLLKTTKS